MNYVPLRPEAFDQLIASIRLLVSRLMNQLLDEVDEHGLGIGHLIEDEYDDASRKCVSCIAFGSYTSSLTWHIYNNPSPFRILVVGYKQSPSRAQRYDT